MAPQWYLDYLATPRWQTIRIAVIARAGHRCQSEGCYRRTRLQVHHLTYARVGHERPGDLKVLCDGCHRRAHGLAPIPVTPAHFRAPVTLSSLVTGTLQGMRDRVSAFMGITQ